MLGSGTHARHERRGRRVAARKSALSSRVSLLSGVTASSSGSSGSGSTITQESISRPHVRSSKANLNAKGKRQSALADGTFTKGRTTPRRSKRAMDVFTFLDKDQSRVSLDSKHVKKGPTTNQHGKRYSPHDDSDHDSDPRSFHSDSGISLDDASSDHASSKMSEAFGRGLDTLQEEHVPSLCRPPVAEQRHHQKLQLIPQDLDEDHPEWYYRTAGLHDEATTPAAMHHDAASGNTEEPESSGYDLLASRLCSLQEPSREVLPPIYRRFERLNHRILLQLQDEIVEMEEDLQHMDRADARERTARHGSKVPASRRLDWQWRGSELHARRLELLGRIYLKVEQYSKSTSHNLPQTSVLMHIKIKPSPRSSGWLRVPLQH